MKNIGPALEAIMARSTGFNSIAFFLRIPTPARKQHFLGVEKLNKVVYELIARGREKLKQAEPSTQGTNAQIMGTQSGGAPTGAPKDLLTLLLSARDDDGNSMSDQQLRDEVITILLAGHETTALNLSSTWYLLAKDPAVEEKPHAALAALLGRRPPPAADLPKRHETDP